jgi:predicted RND superfamily exporter protein
MRSPAQALIRLHTRSPIVGATLACVITILLAFHIGGLVIEGSSVKDMAKDNPYLQTELRISDLYSNNTLVTLIVEPEASTISDVLDNLGQLQNTFFEHYPLGEFRSILHMKDQLFLYGLDGSDPIDKLLDVVSNQKKTTNLVSLDTEKFLILLGVPNSLRDRDQLSFIHQQDVEHIKSIKPLSPLHLRWDTEQSIGRDLGVLVPSITIIVLLIAGAGFGSVIASILLTALLTISGLVILSLFSLFSVSINLITLLAIPIVLILSLASAFHLLSFVSEYRQRSESHAYIVEKTLKRLIVPLSLSTTTTVVALATFGFSPIKPIAQLGLLAATAMLLMLVITLLLAPLGLHWFLRTSHQTNRLGVFTFVSRTLGHNRKFISIALLTLMLGSLLSVHLEHRRKLYGVC